MPDRGITAILWAISAGLAAVLGWYLGGWRLALLAGACIAYFAIFGLWKPAMTSLVLVLVSALMPPPPPWRIAAVPARRNGA